MKKIIYNTTNTYNDSSVPYNTSKNQIDFQHDSSVPCENDKLNDSSLTCNKSDKKGESKQFACDSSVPYETIDGVPVNLLPVYKILMKKFMVNRPIKDSRVYSNITNLKRIYRPFLRLDGKELLGFDISNSQPLLATIIFKQYSLDIYGKIKADVLEYQQACERGDFYNYFMPFSHYKIENEDDKSRFKGDFFGSVFYTMETDKVHPLKTAFKEKYPTCYEALFMKKGGKFSHSYKNFPAEMTKLETQIIWETNMELIKAGYDAINIFDSLYATSKEGLELAKSKVIEKFSKFNITPKLKNTHTTALDTQISPEISPSIQHQEPTKKVENNLKTPKNPEEMSDSELEIPSYEDKKRELRDWYSLIDIKDMYLNAKEAAINRIKSQQKLLETQVF